MISLGSNAIQFLSTALAVNIVDIPGDTVHLAVKNALPIVH